MTSTASDAPRLRRLAIEMLLLSAVAVGLPAFAWIRGDGRLSLGAAGVIAMATALLGYRVSASSSVRKVQILGVCLCITSLFSVCLVGAYLAGNWHFLEGRLQFGHEEYSAAMDSYEAALGLIDPAEPMLIGPPFRWRLTSQGIVQDRRVEMYGDLGYVAYLGGDMETSVAAYELALECAQAVTPPCQSLGIP